MKKCKMRVWLGVVSFVVAMLGSSGALLAQFGHGHGSGNPPGWDFFARIPRAIDHNPDPRIVEIFLTAEETEVRLSHGVLTTVFAYNGHVPGLRIVANVGDTLIVHLQNNLPVGTSIHFHGVELPAEMDGSSLAQLEVLPGDSFTYEYKVLNPATHWYHPHFRTNEQIDLGLAGPLIFRDPSEEQGLAAAGLPHRNQLTLIVDDMLLDTDGQHVAFATQELEIPEEDRTLTPEEICDQVINGREGNTILVNGRRTPTVFMRRGTPQRFRIINSANGRFMRLSIPGHTFQRIGGDGGLLEEAIAIPPVDLVPDPDEPGNLISNPDPSVGLLLTPSERADIVFTPQGHFGQILHLEWHDFPRGRHSILTDGQGGVIGLGDDENDGKSPPVNVLRIVLLGFHPPHGSGLNLPTPLPRSSHSPLVDIRDDVDLGDFGQGVPDDVGEALPVFFGHAPPQSSGAITFFVAVQNRDGLLDAIRAKTAETEAAAGAVVPGMVGPPPFGPRPFAAVDVDVALDVTIGETRFWEVVNFTGADHPFHPHGFFFEPIETLIVNLGDGAMGIPSSVERITYPLEYKDSIRLPGRPGTLGRSWTITRGAVRFDDTHRAHSPLGLVRSDAQLSAFGGLTGSAGTGHPQLGDSGGWVFHCHINEHADQGMMSFYNLMVP